MDNSNFAQQGWQCPICKRVYAPNTPMCWYCGGESVITTTNTFKSTVRVDWLTRDSITVSEDSE